MRHWLMAALDPPAFRTFLQRVRSCDLRHALALCLPAAVLAIALRCWLIVFMPAAFVHNDTSSIVETADRLVHHGAFVLDTKKTFLEPAIYCLPALLHIPVLPFLSALQHLLGVFEVFLGGLLVFSWCRHWRWLIVPATLCLALDPVLLWYEHTALAESYAVFGILLVALTATAFYRIPNRYTFAALGLATLLMAGARPEGRLFALFTTALVIRTWWGSWRLLGIGTAIAGVWAIAIFAITRTGQSGLLLLTSVLQLSPPHLTLSPGIAETLAPLAEKIRFEWTRKNPPKLVALRKQIASTLVAAQIANGVPPSEAKKQVNTICARAGFEIALRNLTALPGLALRKFVIAHRELPSGDFTSYAIDGQMDALFGDTPEENNLRYAPLLWRQHLTSREDAQHWLQTTYHPVDALTQWLRTFVTATLAPLAPWRLPGSSTNDVHMNGIPWLYACALLGMAGLALRDRVLGFHQLWGAFLIALFVMIMVTANIRARFRVLFEPFWILYALALLDTLLILAARLRPSRSA